MRRSDSVALPPLLHLRRRSAAGSTSASQRRRPQAGHGYTRRSAGTSLCRRRPSRRGRCRPARWRSPIVLLYLGLLCPREASGTRIVKRHTSQLGAQAQTLVGLVDLSVEEGDPPTVQDVLSVACQLAVCEDLVTILGWVVADLYVVHGLLHSSAIALVGRWVNKAATLAQLSISPFEKCRSKN